MKRQLTYGAALASVGVIGGAVLPSAVSAAPSQIDNTTTARDTGPDFSTPAAVRQYFAQLGVTGARVDQFAAGLGLDAEGYYQLVARSSTSKPSGPPPIEVVNGKVRYNNNVSKSMSFVKTQTRNQTGKKVSGRCVFEPITADGNIGDNVVSEVIEVDPQGCTRTIFDGAYDPAAVQRTSAQAASSVVTAKAASGPQFLNCNSLTGPPTLYQPNVSWADGEWRRYYKQSFVDPICITITSSTLNVRWKNGVNSGTNVTLLGRAGNPFYYTSLGEQWPAASKQFLLVPTEETVTKATEVQAFLGHTRVETDFPEHLALAAAAAGLGPFAITAALCGFDFSDTGFNSIQRLYVRRNAGWFASGSGDVWGGCSSLIHERVWHGSGSYAR